MGNLGGNRGRRLHSLVASHVDHPRNDPGRSHRDRSLGIRQPGYRDSRAAARPGRSVVVRRLSLRYAIDLALGRGTPACSRWGGILALPPEGASGRTGRNHSNLPCWLRRLLPRRPLNLRECFTSLCSGLVYRAPASWRLRACRCVRKTPRTLEESSCPSDRARNGLYSLCWERLRNAELAPLLSVF